MVNHITKLNFFRVFPLFGVMIFVQLCFWEIFMNNSLFYDGEKENDCIENSELYTWTHRVIISLLELLL